MHIEAINLSDILADSLTMGDRGDRYNSYIARENGEVLLYCFYPNDSVRTSEFIDNTLSDVFRATGIHVMVAEDLDYKDGRPRADHLRRVRVVSVGQVVFDRVISVGASHAELFRWRDGGPAFDRTLP